MVQSVLCAMHSVHVMCTRCIWFVLLPRLANSEQKRSVNDIVKTKLLDLWINSFFKSVVVGSFICVGDEAFDGDYIYHQFFI